MPRRASTFPLSIPHGAVGRYGNVLSGVEYRLSARGEAAHPEVQLFSVPREGGYLPMLFSRYSNLPTAHRAHPSALRDESPAPSGSQTDATCEQEAPGEIGR